jgi:hypothetical protein
MIGKVEQEWQGKGDNSCIIESSVARYAEIGIK